MSAAPIAPGRPPAHDNQSVGAPGPGSAGRLRTLAAGLLRFLLAFSPAVVLAILIERHAVNVPMWDDWERAPLIEKWKEGSLTFHDLYAPHISHRILVPRLIMLGSAAFTGGDLRTEIWVTYSVTVLAAIGFLLLLRRTVRPGHPGIWWAVFFANLMLFSPLQGQNFLWPIQHAFVIPMACGVWALVTLGAARLPVWLKFGLCLVLALVANHSFHHGVLVWFVVLAFVALRSDFAPPRQRWGFLALWSILFLVTAAFYYDPDTFRNVSHPSHAYGQPVGERPPGFVSARTALERPDKLSAFFFGMLGSAFARSWPADPLPVAIVIGATVLMLFAAGVLWWLVRFRDRELRDRVLPWLAIGGMAVSACVMVALARSGTFAEFRALAPRYVSISCYLFAAIPPLAMVLAQGRVAPAQGGRTGAAGGRGRLRPAFIRDSGLVLAGAVLLAVAVQWGYGVQTMRAHSWARQHARTNLLFLDHFRPQRVERLDADYGFLRRSADILARHGMLDPAPLEEPTLGVFRRSGSPLRASRAGFTHLAPAPDGDDSSALLASGYAELPHAGGQPAHGVILTATQVGGAPADVPIALADIDAFPRMWFHFWDFEYNGIRLFEKHEFSKWRTQFVLPAHLRDAGRPVLIEAWAVDAKAMRIYALPERYRVTFQGGKDGMKIQPVPRS